MSVNSSPTAWQQNMKKLAVSNFLTFIAGVIDNGDLPLLSNISAIFKILT
jgi:hypothetical protein